MLEMITEEVDRYQQCWMTHLLMLVIQFAPRRWIYFSLKITVTFTYGIFKKVDTVASLSIFLFFKRSSVYQVGDVSENTI